MRSLPAPLHRPQAPVYVTRRMPGAEAMQNLEEQIAHLTRTVDELNDIVTAQQTEIDRLTRRVAMLMEREAARDAEGGGGHVFGDERPPHY